MAGLAHGLPIVTTSGSLTEDLWSKSRAVALAPEGNIDEIVERTQHLLADEAERQRLKGAARALYNARFDIQHTVSALSGGESLWSAA
jgi:glycosyltransferase involved in cell wall biosynthesis